MVERNRARTRDGVTGTGASLSGDGSVPAPKHAKELKRLLAGPRKNRPMLGLALILGATIAAAAVALVAARNSTTQATQLLEGRFTAMRSSALASGSVLACLEPDLGSAIVQRCEAALFTNPGALAAAAAYSAERLAWLSDALKIPAPRRSAALVDAIARTQNALQRDRFGIVASLLAETRGCTAAACEAFALLPDPGRVRDQMREQFLQSSLARYEALSAKPQSPEVSPQPAPETQASAPPPPAPTRKPIPDKYALPSAASIPAINIMVPEPEESAPKRPKSAPPRSEGGRESRAPSQR